jgi:catechol 2,3-dioxygenase
MTTKSIHPDTRLGYVHLTVSDLDRSLRFYQESLGFRFSVHRREGNTAYLGAGREDLLVLTGDKHAPPRGHATGLYHFAIRVPSRVELGYVLRNMIEHDLELGFGDHYVSEAIYLSDPDDNGIEIYRDRPRSQWQYVRGQLVMGTEMVDVRGVLGELRGQPEEWQGLHPDTVLGHMHIQVSNLRAAMEFYHDVIGFDVMAQMGGSAGFVSAGGYHHHLGLNTWESLGGSPPPPGTTGLYHVAILYPSRAALADALRRLMLADIRLDGVSDHGVSEALYLRDPDQNGVELYWDKPQELWPRTPDGQLAMFTRKLDLDSLLQEPE